MKCGAIGRGGTPCARPAGWGTGHPGVGRCKHHLGATKRSEKAGALALARRQATVMGVETDVDPHEAILKCIRICHGEVIYASERIAELAPEDAVGPVVTIRPRKGEYGMEAHDDNVEELGPVAVNIWIEVRRRAMRDLVDFSKAAIVAGIAEREIELAEAHAQMLAEAMRNFARAMGFDPADPAVRTALRGSLALIEGGRAPGAA